jgi:hypothetical protein
MPLKLLPAEHFILDGEIAALDEKGRSSFQLLRILKSSGNVPVGLFCLCSALFRWGRSARTATYRKAQTPSQAALKSSREHPAL